MDSLLAMYIEVRYQLEDLIGLNLKISDRAENCLFVGSGDSHVAALIAQYASSHMARSCFPTDILADPDILKNKTLYFISISGNTLDNILAARLAKRKNVKTVAITRYPKSKLANVCDEVIELNYRTTGITTSGSVGFSACVLACLSLLRKIDRLPDLTSIFDVADKISSKIISARNFSSYVILGSGILFPIAIYGALKVNEIIGIRSYAYTVDEFFHAPIFGVRKTDRIIVLDNGSNFFRKPKLFRAGFTGLNIRICDFDCSPQNFLNVLLQSLFVLQLFVIKDALKHELRECSFLTNKRLLKLSSRYIYA